LAFQPEFFQQSATVTLEDEALTTLITIPTARIERMTIQIDVVTTALDQFEVQARPSTAAAFNTIFSSSSDFTTASDVMIKASGDLTALGAASTGWIILFPSGWEQTRIQIARAAGSDATVTAFVGAS